MSESPYSILNVNENASFQEIKSSYRKLSMLHHPDRNPDNPNSKKVFQNINTAYEYLTNNNKYNSSTKFPSKPDNIFNNDSKNVSNNVSNNINLNISKPPPIIINLEVDFHKIYTGSSEPIYISRWIIEENIKRDENETIYISIPKGSDDNEIITIKDKGNILANNINGDVKVFIKVINNTPFTRNGLDLIYKKKYLFKRCSMWIFI